jgi:hypothetical protein
MDDAYAVPCFSFDLASETSEEPLCRADVEEHDGRMRRELLDPMLDRFRALVFEDARFETSEEVASALHFFSVGFEASRIRGAQGHAVAEGMRSVAAQIAVDDRSDVIVVPIGPGTGQLT